MHAELNWTVLGLAVALSVLTGVLFGLVPALQATRLDMVSALNDARTTDYAPLSRRLRAGPALVVLQVALSVPLLVAAGLFGRTLSNLNAIDVGFSRDNVLLFTIRPAVLGYEGLALGRLYEDVREQLNHLPGVVGASLSARPFPMGGGSSVQVTLDGVEAVASAETPDAKPPYAVIASVGADFFKTMKMPLAAGRDITAADTTTAPRVVVVNRHVARLFGLQNPVGQTLVAIGTRFEIVGVVDDAVAFSLTEKRFPVIYLSYLQGLERSPTTAWSAPTQMTYEVRTNGHPMNLAGPVRDLVRRVDSGVAIHDLKTQATHIGQAITREIALARLGTMVAILALVMACVGLYGTVSFNVSRRTKEIGIRMALGAHPGRIVRMAAGEVLLQVTIGLVAGLSVSLLGARYVKSLLYGVTPNDPLTIAGAVAALLLCGLLSTFIPAGRATRVDPMRAVRQD
jgi:macrolide transport system ATP-binding/permease protein